MPKRFVSYLTDGDGVELTGLSPTITIREIASPFTTAVSEEIMTEIWDGVYTYNFSSYDVTKEYFAKVNPQSDLVPNKQIFVTEKLIDNLDATISSRSTLTAPQVRTELTTELSRIDVATSTRASQSSVTALPTLANIEWSTVIAKETTANSAKVASESVDAKLTTWRANNLDNLDATVSSRGTLTAPQVRTELSTELARIDVATSTRLASAWYTAPDNSGIWTLNTKLTTTRANNLDNLDVPVSSVGWGGWGWGDTKEDIYTYFTTSNREDAFKTDISAIPTNPLLTNDSRLDRLDANISTRSTLTAPQVRTELATELGRIDDNISTRLPTASYVAPDNANVSSILAKVNLLERMQRATVRIDTATNTFIMEDEIGTIQTWNLQDETWASSHISLYRRIKWA